MKHKKVLAISLAALLLVSTAVQFTSFGENLNIPSDSQEITGAQVDEDNSAADDSQTEVMTEPSGWEDSNSPSGENASEGADEEQPGDTAGTDNADGAGTGDSQGNTDESQNPGTSTSEEQNKPEETEKTETLDYPAGLKANRTTKNSASVSFAWKWKDDNQQAEGANHPANLLGNTVWNEGEPVSEPRIDDAYMEIAVFVQNSEGQYGSVSGDSLSFGEEKTHMNLWQFWHYVGGYSWGFIKENENALVNASSTTNPDGDVEIAFDAGRLITRCETLDSNEQYTVTYGLEPVKAVPGYSVAHPSEGADKDRILVAEPEQNQDGETGEDPADGEKPTDEEIDQTVQDAVDDAAENLEKVEDAIGDAAENDGKLTKEQITALIEKIESEINSLPDETEDIGMMPEDDFAALKEKLQSIKTDMAVLLLQQTEQTMDARMNEKYQSVLKTYDTIRLAQIEQRIVEIGALNEAQLAVQEDDLRKELTAFIDEVADIWADFNSGTEEDKAKQEEINHIRESLIALLKKLSNWIDKPEALDAVKLNESPVVLTWQWNDHNIQQAGATRPSTPLFGTATAWAEDNTPYGQNAYIKLVVKVKRGDSEPESMSLWQFLTTECGYAPEYVKKNFPAFASADSRLLVSNNHGSDLETTWNTGRLITSYTKNGVEYTVTYGLEQVEGKDIPGYQVERVNEQTLRATPVDDFNATVVWYDNHNHYYDENHVSPRPDGGESFSEYKGKIQLVRFTEEQLKCDVITDADINITNNPDAAPDKAADAWAVSIEDLPKYGPNGEKYTYYLKQEADGSGNLPTGVSTAAYYKPSITNDDLVEDEHPNLVKDDGTLTNTLARQGKVEIHKVWKDGNTPKGDRPNTTLHYYRISETDLIKHNSDTDHTFFGFNGSPVPGNDSRTNIEKLGSSVEIELPASGTLPMFDEQGRRYVYYAVERMENQGDYVTEVDNSSAGPILLPNEELRIVREEATKDGHNYILNGATVTNKLEKKITIPVTVEFKAQSIQNDMENAVVNLQLQCQDRDGNWHDYNKDTYDGTLTLDKFRAETMTLSGSSDEVDKYDEEGYEIKYRWVQTAIGVNGGTSGTLNRENKEVTVRTAENAEVGPGVEENKTTLHFDVEYGEEDDNTKITNTLVGNTQVVVSKKWTYTVTGADGQETTYIYPGDWDGKATESLKLPVGVQEPAEIELKYPLLQNGKPYLKDGEEVYLTIEKGKTDAKLGGLPRYDENGNEYTYTLNEQEPEGWFNLHSDYTKSVEDDMAVDGDKVTQISSAHENIIGPGKPLVFEVSKEWEDDTDIATRCPVTVGVFSLDGGEPVKTAELNMKNNWYQKIVIEAPKGKTVDNYVVKEISVGIGEKSVNVQDTVTDMTELKGKATAFNEAFTQPSINALNAREVSEKDLFAEHRYNPAALNEYIVGTLGMNGTDSEGNLEFQYNVYLRTQQITDKKARYAIYNQRQGEIIYNLEKTWINDGQKSKAYFAIERKDGEKWEPFEWRPFNREIDSMSGNSIVLDTEFDDVNENGQTTARIDGIMLPKYDALGRIIEYRLRETHMSVFNRDGNEIRQEIEDNIADFGTSDGSGDRYTCTVKLDHVDYKQSQWLEKKTGASPHHSGDEYLWKGENTRKDDCDISVYKVWRDGGLPVNELNAYNAHRPDICFHLYRVSQRELRNAVSELDLATGGSAQRYVDWMKKTIKSESDIIDPGENKTYRYGIERVNDDYLWTTSTVEGHENAVVNNWLWKCEISKQMPRYDEYGSPYIYFLFEELRANADNYVASYCNKPVSEMTSELPNGAGKTTETTFKMTDGLESGFLLIVDGETGTFKNTNTPPAQNDDADNSKAAASEETSLYSEYYSRIVVNTRQKGADVSGKKIWNLPDGIFVGENGIPYDQMPDVNLKLYRDKASVGTDGKYVAASFKKAIKIDELTATGKDGKQFKYAFPSEEYKQNNENKLIPVTQKDGSTRQMLPRYDKYGYRYSYWITEEPLDNFTSPNMGEKDETAGTEGSSLKPQAGVFDLTNTYKTEPPYVKIDLTKEWNWPETVEESKKNLTVTFNLHAVIADKNGQPIMNGSEYAFDEIFDSKEIKVNDGVAEPISLTFEKATQGYLAGSSLPYYGPNGQPYLYYVEEVQPNGYTVTCNVSKKVEIVPEPETAGLLDTIKAKAASFFSSSSDASEVPEAADGNTTALFRPVLNENETEASASVAFINNYDGDLGEEYNLSIKKKWNQWTDKGDSTFNGNDFSSLQPNKEIKVKLYRQWKLGGGSYGWEQVKGPDVNSTMGSAGDGAASTGWSLMDNNGTFTLSPNSWSLTGLTGLYKTAPNKEPYEYFVVEQDNTLNSADSGGFHGYFAALSPDTHPDVSVSEPDGASFNTVEADGMEKRRGYSKSVVLGSKDSETSISVQPVNDLLYKKVSYTKTWKMKLSQEDEAKEIEASRMVFLALTGALPEKLHFVLQYQIGDSRAWNYLPTSGDIFTGTSVSTRQTELSSSEINGFVHRTYPLSNQYRLEEDNDKAHSWKPQGSWNYLPAYTWNGVQKTEVNYRVVEVMEFADNHLVIKTPDATGTDTASDNITTSAGITEIESSTPRVKNTAYAYTNTMKLKPLVIRKVWVGDNANRDDTRPSEIKITIKSENEPTHSFDVILKQTDIKKNDVTEEQKGNIYESQPYYVPANATIENLALTAEEVGDISGYDKTDSVELKEEPIDPQEPAGAKRFVFTATNTLNDDTTRKTIDLTAEKTWAGEDGVAWHESLRPAKITFTLQYRYNSNGVTPAIEWTDATKAATGISDDSEAKKEVALDADNKQKVTWGSVYQYYEEDKTAIPIPMQYRVVETMYDESGNPIVSAVQPYNPSTGEFTRDGKGVISTPNLIVTNTLKTVQVSAVKQWKWKNENQTGVLTKDQIEMLKEQGIIPDYIRFELYYKTNDAEQWSKLEAFGYEDAAVTDLINEDGTPKTYTSQKKLPKYDKNGNEIKYRLVETGIYYGDNAPTAEGQIIPVSWQDYQQYITGRVGDFDVDIINESAVKTVVTNTLSAKISIPVTKEWKDYNNQDGKRPEAVTIHLLADGSDTGKTLTFSDENRWSGTFENLDKYKGGKLIAYTITEDSVIGYTTAITGTVTDSFTVTNSHAPETITISGTKTWVDDNDKAGARPDSIILRIHGFVEGKEIRTYEIQVTKDTSWSWTQTLPKYDQGKEITYTVTEDWVSSYQTEIKEENGGYHITNTYVPPAPLPATVNFSVIKKWNDENDKDGLRPAQVVIRLYADGADTGKLLTLSEANHWAGSFTSLDEYKDGKKIVYTIKEDSTEGYTAEIAGSAAAGFVVTNTHTPGTVDVSGKKIWKDNGNKAGKRPDSVTLRVHIFADGEEVETREVKVTAKDSWKWSLGELPEYKDGKRMTYTVTEDQVKGYKSRIDGFDVYNTYTASTPAELSIPVLKSWDDSNNRDRIRPSSVIIRLYADGKDTGKMLTLSEQNGWSGSFKGLKESKNGKKIHYTIKEDEIRWYTATVSGSAASGFVVSNYHKLGDLPPDEGLMWNDPSGKNPNGPNGSGDGSGRYPGTGDDSNMLPWMALLISSAGALTVLWTLRRKKKNQ